MKQPEIKVEGTLQFQELRSNDPHNPTRPWANAVPARIDGVPILQVKKH
jgi:hypothetical protein